MEHLKMHSMNKIDENVSKIEQLFPNCVTEAKADDGTITKKIDFDMLKQELSSTLVEGREERYQFTWPDKKQAILTANAPINKTLRPCRDESVNFDETENLYIEGDNLEVLKLLQETYLGKIKMIYIDPPYNTGNDFVYNDDFAQEADDYIIKSGQVDINGNHLVANTESNGRFHSDWLNMMYPRLKLSKDLLSDDGLIFISIDDCEQINLRKIADELFGITNFVTEFVWKCRNSLQHDESLVSKQTERILLYAKNKQSWNGESGNKLNRIRKPYDATEYKNPDNDPRGPWLSSGKTRNDGRPSYTVVSPTGKEFTKPWIPSPAEFKRWEEEGLIWWGKDGNSIPRKKAFLKDFKGNAISDILFDEYTDEIKGENKIKRTKTWEIGTTETGTKGEKDLFNGKAPFDYPKPWTLIKYFVQIATNENDIVLDFFSGSGTTAHSVMKLESEINQKRKFILVQIPELTYEAETEKKVNKNGKEETFFIIDEKTGRPKIKKDSEANKDGLWNICEIGKERIRRAGKQIKDEIGLQGQDLDIGFRVLKCDTSNMEDVYYSPEHFDKQDLFKNNIKSDRTAEDLLFQVMLDLGIMLSSKIQTKQIDGKTVYCVEGNYLMACFDDTVDEATITEIAKEKPYYFVMRDPANSKDGDSLITNFEQIFTTYSPETVRKIL